MLSTNWNPDPELAKQFIAYESYCFSRSFVDSASEEVECDEPETMDIYSRALRSYVDSDADPME